VNRSPPLWNHNLGLHRCLSSQTHLRHIDTPRTTGWQPATTPVTAADSCCSNPRAVGWSVTADRGDHSPLLDPTADARPVRRMRNGSTRRSTERPDQPHTAAPAGTHRGDLAKGHLCPPTAPASNGNQHSPYKTERDDAHGTTTETKGKRKRDNTVAPNANTNLPCSHHRRLQQTYTIDMRSTMRLRRVRSFPVCTSRKHWQRLRVAIGLQHSQTATGARTVSGALGAQDLSVPNTSGVRCCENSSRATTGAPTHEP